MNENEFTLIAKTFAGLEETLAAELTALGAKDALPITRAVSFTANQEIMYRANLEARTAIKILKPIAEFTVRDERDLYGRVGNVDWTKLVSPDGTISVESFIKDSPFNHANYVALKTKDAIVDQLRARTGARPSVDAENPDLLINAHVRGERVTLSLDSSGRSLHMRGWRVGQTEASLSEVLAAGMIQLAGYTGEEPFFDPMCGSGTLAIEAALLSANIPPGVFRKNFGFFSWHDFDPKLWKSVKARALSKIIDLKAPIYAYDSARESVDIARKNIQSARLEGLINLEQMQFEGEGPAPEHDSGIMIMNPPFGERLKVEQIEEFYKTIGDTLKKRYSGWTAWILTSNLEAAKKIGLHASRNIKLFNGKLECKFMRYNLYKGSLKQKSAQPDKELNDLQ